MELKKNWCRSRVIGRVFQLAEKRVLKTLQCECKSHRAYQKGAIMQFTDDEIEIIKEVFSDWGSDMPCTDYDKVRGLGIKLGVWEEEKPPTEEELKRREEFRNSPYGLMISKLFSQTNDYFNKMAEELVDQKAFMDGEQWGDGAEIGTKLRIKFPKDFKG